MNYQNTFLHAIVACPFVIGWIKKVIINVMRMNSIMMNSLIIKTSVLTTTEVALCPPVIDGLLCVPPCPIDAEKDVAGDGEASRLAAV